MKVAMYHYVHPRNDNWLKGLKALDLKNFALQLDFFEKNFHILKPNSFIEEIAEGHGAIPVNSVLLTFDDGYKDCIDYIMPEMQKRNINGVFFVPNYYVSGQLLDVNSIHLLLTKEENVTSYLDFIDMYLKNHGLVRINEHVENIVFESRYDSREIELMKNLLQWMIPVEHRKIILEQMINKYFDESSEFYFDKFYCSTSDLNEMISAGNIIGGHTVNHGWMGKCSAEEQELEITGSTELLENLLPQKYKSFSYPFGSYNEDSIRLLRKHNYKVSFTTAADSWKPAEVTCFEIPRLDTNDFPPISEGFKNFN